MRLIVGAIVMATATPALGLAPCFEVCHLSQGQPLLVEGEIWVRPCATDKGVTTCVVERRDREGRVLATLPGEATDDEDAFEDRHLIGRTVTRLFYGTAWSKLRAPYQVSRASSTMTLRLAGSTLICERAGAIVKRPLGCRPHALSVRTASTGTDATGVAVVIGTCGSKAAPREVIAVCEAKP